MPLEDCMAAIIDYRGKSPEKTTFGVPLVTAKIVKGGRIEEPEEYIAEKDYDAWMRRGIPKAGDVVMTTEAPLGEVAQLDDRKVALAQRVIALRGKPGVLDNTFLKFLLQSDSVQEELRSRGTGTTVVGIRQSELRKVLLTFPPLAEQKAIASVLGALDDKIELNRRMNATLEGMARALFQSWFVDFDPVRAKLDRRQPANLDPATGWSRTRWGDIATLEYGKSLRDYRKSGGKYRVFGTNGPIGFHNEALCDGAGIAIGRKGAYRGVHYSPDPFFVIDTAFFLKPKAALDLKWAYYELLRFDINSMDSGSAIPSTSRDDFYGIPVIVPPSEIQAAFGKIVGGWFAKVFANARESRTLATLRDTLLPKLLSGEVSAQEFDEKRDGA
jgi:type I restriction enzyme S subunit